jgi:Uncharacterized protein conserved in bacteria
MPIYISILRGINVSGHNKIRMDALRELFIDAGFKNVRTYIQSGNVVFKTKKTAPAALSKIISAKIKEQFGCDVPVLVIELDELKKVVANNPFAEKKIESSEYLYVTFLSGIPLKENIDKIPAKDFLPDEFVIIDTAVYLYCIKSGYGNTKLNNNFFENKLMLTATTRNWKTVNELVRLSEAGL